MISHKVRIGVKYFTLVELLVVIAIISILSGILLPALGNGKKKAFSSICTSNLKNLFSAYEMYRNDNNGEAFGSACGGDLRNTGGWVVIYRTYYFPDVVKQGQTIPNPVMHCPCIPADMPMKNMTKTTTYPSYVYVRVSIHVPGQGGVPVSVNKFRNLSSLICFGDGSYFDYGASGPGDLSPRSAGQNVYLGEWHIKGKGNAVFRDGHTEFVPGVDYNLITINGVDYQRMRVSGDKFYPK